MTASSDGPVVERLHWLDALRGFTLVGVLLVNLSDYSRNPKGNLDPLWYQLMGIATGGKFATLFQILFGVGFAVQMTRWLVPDGRVVGRYLLRCIALFIIGWAAEFLIGGGAILITYAMTAVFLLFFRRSGPRAALGWGLAFIVASGAGLDRAIAERVTAGSDNTRPGALYREYIAREGSYLPSRVVRARMAWEVFRQGHWLPRFGTLGLFLLGLALWRGGIFLGGTRYIRHLAKMVSLAIPLGLAGQAALSGLGFWAGDAGGGLPQALRGVVDHTTVLLLSLGYAALVLWLIEAGRMRRLFDLLALQGRMGLTVFILQYAAMGIIFFRWGLGYSELSFRWDLPLTIAITGMMIAFAGAWFSLFRVGPLEWLWRTMTYLTPVRLRKMSTAATAA
jgi:uncharacterized protein